MSKPTTIRLPDELLREVDARAKAHGQDRAAFLRTLLRNALARDVELEVLSGYARGDVSFSEACARLGLDAYRMFELLQREKLRLDVSFEDWMDSKQSL